MRSLCSTFAWGTPTVDSILPLLGTLWLIWWTFFAVTLEASWIQNRSNMGLGHLIEKGVPPTLKQLATTVLPTSFFDTDDNYSKKLSKCHQAWEVHHWLVCSHQLACSSGLFIWRTRKVTFGNNNLKAPKPQPQNLGFLSEPWPFRTNFLPSNPFLSLTPLSLQI